MKRFDRFIGIDWSGAKGMRQPGIAIATAAPGRSAPMLLKPSDGRAWSRMGVVDWLVEELRDFRTIVGFDFAFGFPTVEGAPPTPSWEAVEAFCRHDTNLYGGRFFDGTEHDLRDYVFGQKWKGPLFARSARRQTEAGAARVKGASPSTAFLAIGPAQVGPSTVSGMRALHHLRQRIGPQLCVWPFDDDHGTGPVIVEIFPRYYPLQRGLPASMKDGAKLNAALAAYGSELVDEIARSEDEGDALISAAALRALSAEPGLWGPLPREARSEGWIFGVPPGM